MKLHLIAGALVVCLLPSTASANRGIWISDEEIAALPMSGPAWTSLKAEADKATGTLDIEDEFSPANVRVLAKALACSRTHVAKYCADVEAAIAQVALWGPYYGRALGMGRELGAYVIAADVISLSSRNPALNVVFVAKLKQLKTAKLSGGPATLIKCHEQRANNWGTMCGGTRMAIDLYVGDLADLAAAADVFEGWLGNRSAYAGFKFGDLSWQASSSTPVGINPVGCTKSGHSIDGVLPDDQRRAGSFTWPPPAENYAYGALQGALAQAVLLSRAGYDVWNWENQALLRAFEWLHEQAGFDATGDDQWEPHVVNRFYGTNFPARVPSKPGKNVGWTDWTVSN